MIRVFPFNRLYYPQYVSYEQVIYSYVENAVKKVAGIGKSLQVLYSSILGRLLENFKTIESIRKHIIESFFSEYYTNLSQLSNKDKDIPKKDNNYSIILYCQLGDKYVKPIYNRSNYQNILSMSNPSNYHLSTLFPFSSPSNNSLATRLFYFLKFFPFFEFKSDLEESICFNSMFMRSIIRKKYVEGKNKLLDYAYQNNSIEIDTRPFNEIVTEFNYYDGYNIQPVIKIINDKVEFI